MGREKKLHLCETATVRAVLVLIGTMVSLGRGPILSIVRTNYVVGPMGGRNVAVSRPHAVSGWKSRIRLLEYEAGLSQVLKLMTKYNKMRRE